MPNLKDIKSRIGSVQNTKKITKAMKMVAAAKVKKAENTVKAARPFSDELLHLFRKMLATVTELSVVGLKVDKGIENYPALLTRREVKTEGLLVITSNKGLAGAYNANIIKTTLKRIKENTEKGIKTVIYPVGQKAISGFKHKNGNFELRDGYTAVANEPTALGANLIAEDIANDFVCGKIDKIDIITTHFNNMMSYNSTAIFASIPSSPRTTFIVFLPTPGKVSNIFLLYGILESYSSTNFSAISCTNFAFL